VEITKRGIDAFNRRDLEGFSEVATADFEFVPALLAIVEGGSIVGRDGLQAFFAAIPNTWDESTRSQKISKMSATKCSCWDGLRLAEGAAGWSLIRQ
jgi:hypothetical protein